jgi:multidrug efflux pump subunit AcrB
MALIGIIMLVGIVVNNGIVLVDFINQLRHRGKELFDAIMEAGRARMRPVLMTALTTILAMLPGRKRRELGADGARRHGRIDRSDGADAVGGSGYLCDGGNQSGKDSAKARG